MANAPTGSRRTSGYGVQQSTNNRNHANALSDSLKRLSVNEAAQTPLPPSSPIVRSPRPDLHRTVSSPRPSPNPLRRCSSSMSIDRRSSTPALMRKTSTSSLRNVEISPTPKLGTRRSSSQLHPSSPLAPAMEEPTPNTIAESHFQQELGNHGNPEAAVNTVVILHDSCYGHRFSRPKTTKSTLGLIVERPERIQAGVMGISAAYVRLGERHEGGRYAPDPRSQVPAQLPFKIRRTARTIPLNAPAVTQVHGTKWMEELKVMCDLAGQKLSTTGRETERPPDPANKDKPIFHSGDLYLCAESLAAFEGALGGVCEGVDTIFEGTATGRGPSQAFVCVRPPGHHCSADFPSGFCWLNNVHVGIQHAVHEHGLTHAAIIDFDLHHGDGSQAIAWDHNFKMLNMPKNKANSKKSSIGYFSVHDINSYPCENGEPEKIHNASICIENAHNQSIWNVHLQSWKTEAEFWELYETKYMVLIEKARSFLRYHTARLRSGTNQPRPKSAIFISAGFDASEHEGEGMQRHGVNVPTDFYARFTRDIVALAQEEGTAADGRVISVLEGGYSDKALISGVLSHVSGLCEGQHSSSITEQDQSGLASEMARMNMGASLSGLPISAFSAQDVPIQLRYNSEWWASENLDALVDLLNPTAMPQAVIAARKARSGAYSSPTHASSMKKVDPAKVYRSSSSHRFPGMASVSPSRAPSPPPPSVDWATASQELCKLLIPKDRSTTSCTVVELSANKVKKERHSTIGLSSVAPAQSGRQLRSKAPTISTPDEEDGRSVRSVSRADRNDRRKTIAANELATNGLHAVPERAIATSRRSSAGSTTSAVSAVSMRPPARPAGNGVQVKKTRGRPPAEAPKTNGTVDMQDLTSRFQKARIGSGAGSDVLKSNGNAQVAPTVPKIQRLKINVPSEEQYAARQKAATAKKAPAPRPTKTTTTKRPSVRETKSKAAAVPAATARAAPPVAAAPSSVLDEIIVSPAPPEQAPINNVITPPQATTQPAALPLSSPITEYPPPYPHSTGTSPTTLLSHGSTNGGFLLSQRPASSIGFAPQAALGSQHHTASRFEPDPLSFKQQPDANFHGQHQELTWKTPYSGPKVVSLQQPLLPGPPPPPALLAAGQGQNQPQKIKMPTWTSTGYIPFSPGHGAAGAGVGRALSPSSASNISRSPSRASAAGVDAASVVSVKTEESPNTGANRNGDIWDVPVTPVAK